MNYYLIITVTYPDVMFYVTSFLCVDQTRLTAT